MVPELAKIFIQEYLDSIHTGIQNVLKHLKNLKNHESGL